MEVLCNTCKRPPRTALTQKVLPALELHAMHEHPLVRLAPDKARLVHGGIKIRGAADILAVLDAVSPVLLVELPRLLLAGRADFTAFVDIPPKPVVVLPVCLHRILHALRRVGFEVLRDCFLRPFDDPCQDGGACVLKKIIRIVLDIRIPHDMGIEGNHNQPAPDAVIVRADLRQVVGIQHQCIPSLKTCISRRTRRSKFLKSVSFSECQNEDSMNG